MLLPTKIYMKWEPMCELFNALILNPNESSESVHKPRRYAAIVEATKQQAQGEKKAHFRIFVR